MKSSTVQKLVESVQNHAFYPTNLVQHLALPLNTEAYVKTLDMHEAKLFCSDSSRLCHLRFWECDNQIDGFHDCSAHNLDELDAVLRKHHPDPKSRFVFITAPNSRAALNVTRRMTQLLFSWHQVMPSYVDFLVTFGNRHYGNEFPFTGFRQQLRLSETSRGDMINDLGRSGKDLSLCFNLRSAEKSDDEWPWALRQTAVYHSFDFFSGRAIWIVTKANNLIERRIRSATAAKTFSAITQFDTNSQAFSANLLTHLVFVDWAGENWRWYIDNLEEKAQRLTRPVLQMPLPRPQYSAATGSKSPQPPSTTFSTRSTPEKLSSTASGMTTTETTKLRSSCLHPRPQTELSTAAQPLSMSSDPMSESFANAEEKGFRIEDIQENQFLEDKTNEAMLTIDANLDIMDELARFYKSMVGSYDCPETIRTTCLPHIERLEARIDAVKSDLRMQRSRANSIIRLLSNRKHLLFGILQYQSMQESKILAEKGQVSANEMETMTENMHDIARKTQQETVSMRIITLVTLFFLPGTFISTLMSTDIVRWQGDSSDQLRKTVSIGALEFYLSITIPLMVLTFSAWYLVYWYLNSKNKALDRHKCC